MNGALRVARRAVVVAAGLLVLSGTAAGCGIRGTAVPVDAGSAPSRATCVVRQGAQTAPPEGSVSLSVQLLCASQLLPVTRTVALPGDEDPAGAARALLDELKRQPSPLEDDAGFSTDVPQRLSVSGPRPGDPAGTLRLSVTPDELPAPGLAQVVCTFAGTAAAGGRSTVVLAGPGDERPDRPRSYGCGDEARARPESVRGSGTTVSDNAR
ncbi:lipoprotein [Streptomyces mashuensis]|uniref:Lipoprotein n=1 Tax=Streptomyces mashuensis TaxID=33904 RepID=A0A919B3X3_9ACTN|nr:hypothetical protein [Streptomyces mashuensis]GHF48746.1 lipoprotein [Streptomyces mashuensis]